MLGGLFIGLVSAFCEGFWRAEWSVAVVFGILIAVLIFRDSRETSQAASYVGVTGELRLLTQQIGKSVARAVNGNSTAFVQLKEGSEKFTNYLGVPTPSTIPMDEAESLSHSRWERKYQDTWN